MKKLKIEAQIIDYYSTYLHSLESLLLKNLRMNKIEFYGLEFEITQTYIGYFNDLSHKYKFIIYYPNTYRIQNIIPSSEKYNNNNNIANYNFNIIRFVFNKYDYLYKMKLSNIMNEIYEKVYIIKKSNLTWLIYLGNELPFLCRFDSCSQSYVNEYYLNSLINEFHKQSIIVGIIHISENKLIKPYFSKCKYYIPKNTDNLYKIIFLGIYINDNNINFCTVLH